MYLHVRMETATGSLLLLGLVVVLVVPRRALMLTCSIGQLATQPRQNQGFGPWRGKGRMRRRGEAERLSPECHHGRQALEFSFSIAPFVHRPVINAIAYSALDSSKLTI